MNSVRVLGLGYGTFTIIVGVVVAFLVFVFSRFTRHPELITLLGLMVPVLLILIFALTPKESQRPATVPGTITDPSFIPYIIFLVIAFLGLLLGVFFLYI